VKIDAKAVRHFVLQLKAQITLQIRPLAALNN